MTELHFPFDRPEFGRPVEIAPAVWWLRLPLPFRLDHVNVYLLEDAEGWTVIDTGVDDAETRRIWRDVVGTLFGEKPLRRVIVTHFHPDHVGASAFLCDLTGAGLAMNETEYLTARVQGLRTEADTRLERDFFRWHGLDVEAIETMSRRFGRYRDAVPNLLRRFEPLREGDRLSLAGRFFDVRCHPGHSPSQLLLQDEAGDLLFAADHVLAQISPNISVTEDKPDDDPLGAYLASFARIRVTVPDTVLVLPGHRLPFHGLHARTLQLAAHHAERCSLVLDACRSRSRSVGELVPVLFPMDLDPHQFWFAFSEAMAHVNYLARRGRLVREPSEGITRWSSPEGAADEVAHDH